MGKSHVEAERSLDVVRAPADRDHCVHPLRCEAQRAEIGGETTQEAREV